MRSFCHLAQTRKTSRPSPVASAVAKARKAVTDNDLAAAVATLESALMDASAKTKAMAGKAGMVDTWASPSRKTQQISSELATLSRLRRRFLRTCQLQLVCLTRARSVSGRHFVLRVGPQWRMRRNLQKARGRFWVVDSEHLRPPIGNIMTLQPPSLNYFDICAHFCACLDDLRRFFYFPFVFPNSTDCLVCFSL